MKSFLRPTFVVCTLLATLNFAVTGRADGTTAGKPGQVRPPVAPSVVLTCTPLTAAEFAKYRQMDAHLSDQRAAGAEDNTVLWIAVGAAVVVGIVILASSHHSSSGMGGGY